MVRHVIDFLLNQNVRTVAESGFAILAVLGSIMASVRAWPILRSRAELVKLLEIERSCRKNAEGAVSAFKMAVDGWQSAVESLGAKFDILTEEVESLRRFQHTSVSYMASLILHFRSDNNDTTMPPVPEEIRDDVEQAIRTKRKVGATL